MADTSLVPTTDGVQLSPLAFSLFVVTVVLIFRFETEFHSAVQATLELTI